MSDTRPVSTKEIAMFTPRLQVAVGEMNGKWIAHVMVSIEGGNMNHAFSAETFEALCNAIPPILLCAKKEVMDVKLANPAERN